MSWQRISHWKHLPYAGGIYAVYKKGVTIPFYIGSSKSLHRRFSVNTRISDKYQSISFIYGVENLYFQYKITDDLYIEKLLIKRLQPKFNQNNKWLGYE